MNFNILFGSDGSPGPRLNSFDEGVEFGVQNRNHNREWIPLAFYSFHNPTSRNEEIKIGPDLMLNDRVTLIRGYNVSIYLVGGTMVQGANASNSDIAYLDNVNISINNFPEEHERTTIFSDHFNSESMIK